MERFKYGGWLYIMRVVLKGALAIQCEERWVRVIWWQEQLLFLYAFKDKWETCVLWRFVVDTGIVLFYVEMMQMKLTMV